MLAGRAEASRLKIFPILLYSVAMAYVEAAVVVYLRRIYYPEGFVLTTDVIEPSILRTEIAREVATLAMILGVSLVSFESKAKRLGCFLVIFGVWDIFYYVFLKALLNWPPSMMTMDVLFLIPVPWVFPVVLPVCISVLLVGSGLWLLVKK